MPFGWVAAGLAVAGTAMSYDAQKKAADAQAGEAVLQGNRRMSEAFLSEAMQGVEADSIQAGAAAQAAKIKEQALSMRGSMVSAQAGSGVVIGEGSAQAAEDQIETLAAADVLATLYQGADQSVAVRQQGRWEGQAGANTYLSSVMSAKSMHAAGMAQANATLVSGLASAAGSAYGAYKGGLNTGGKK
jgi:type II secretory pathway component PulC